jgi:hypothetical protein
MAQLILSRIREGLYQKPGKMVSLDCVPAQSPKQNEATPFFPTSGRSRSPNEIGEGGLGRLSVANGGSAGRSWPVLDLSPSGSLTVGSKIELMVNSRGCLPSTAPLNCRLMLDSGLPVALGQCSKRGTPSLRYQAGKAVTFCAKKHQPGEKNGSVFFHLLRS